MIGLLMWGSVQVQVVQDLEATCDSLRNNLHEEAKRTAKYKRAFTEIDGLIAWARSPPVSAGRPARWAQQMILPISQL